MVVPVRANIFTGKVDTSVHEASVHKIQIRSFGVSVQEADEDRCQVDQCMSPRTSLHQCRATGELNCVTSQTAEALDAKDDFYYSVDGQDVCETEPSMKGNPWQRRLSGSTGGMADRVAGARDPRGVV